MPFMNEQAVGPESYLSTYPFPHLRDGHLLSCQHSAGEALEQSSLHLRSHYHPPGSVITPTRSHEE